MTTTAPQDKFPRSLIALMVVFGLLVLALPLIFWFRLDYYEICPMCARQREVQQWLVPFTRVPYYTSAQVADSPLTIELKKLNYLDEHEHQWLIVRGNGPGTEPITGEGVRVAPGLIPPSIAVFVDLLHRYTDSDTESYWFARMTHPQQSDFVRNVAAACTRETFADADAFRARLRKITAYERRLLFDRLGRIDEPEARTPPRLLYQRPPR